MCGSYKFSFDQAVCEKSDVVLSVADEIDKAPLLEVHRREGMNLQGSFHYALLRDKRGSDYYEQFWNQVFDSKEATVLKAQSPEGEIIGFAVVGPLQQQGCEPQFSKNNQQGALTHLYVDRDHHADGVAVDLYRASAHILAEQGYMSMEMAANGDNSIMQELYGYMGARYVRSGVEQIPCGRETYLLPSRVYVVSDLRPFQQQALSENARYLRVG